MARKQSKAVALTVSLEAVERAAAVQARVAQAVHSMMLWDEYAKAALTGLLAAGVIDDLDLVVKKAWDYVDAMMVERALRANARGPKGTG